jgi:uncharacterized SAM-binding protein YcdF (DUF218 family)
MIAALILGCAVWPDGPSPSLRRRALWGAALWHAGAVGHLVACGGLGRHPPAESAVIRRLLAGAGVPDDAVTEEDRSTSTLENIRFALPILSRLGTRTVVLVTDRLHAPRALIIARAHGLTARWDGPGLSGGHPRTQVRMALREAAALPVTLWRLRGPSQGPGRDGDC